ncbi:hypothetical protein [Paenibacillus turpanensis]|uniref:hypothetical protein n=1 Tax=Paenibacillus turpanensis TaxID=2689078 RepID=UPI0014081694|nr:hypothetical protein [Paenibacillus turpanensis]
MVDTFKAWITIVLLIFALIIYPALRTAERTEDQARLTAQAAAREFVDRVRAKGYIDVRDYSTLMKGLDSSGLVLQANFEHSKKLLIPVYDDANDPSTFKNTFSVDYQGYFTKDILEKLFPPGSSARDDHPSRRYKMNVGDLFVTRIESKGTTLASSIRSFLFRTSHVPIVFQYGGMVRNEAP